MKVVICEVGKKAYVKEIGDTIQDMQKIVEGYIEAIYPFDDNACLVCNVEGKWNGMKANRSVIDEEGNLVDIIYGTFFICGTNEEDFGSLTDEQADKYIDKFLEPERMVYWDGKPVMQKM